ncbi:MAG: family 1 glycosylhydrolase [Deltaproteobacteria bacterium]|nr:family 1 glycosylhydrolase [Deltaproteobacteria bacterium]
MSAYKFPDNFLWGTAASAYQTEGGNTHSDWHQMEIAELSRPVDRRRIKQPCGIACDHWNRYEQDFDLAAEIGVRVHRLSVEWSRVFPEPGKRDRAVLDHYRGMITALKSRGIQVMLCLHHFTIPQWLVEIGGYENRRLLIDHFREYLDVTVQSVGELVDYWLPINEPNVVPLAGYLAAYFPPFKRSPSAFIQVFRTFFHMHALSYHVIKKHRPNAPVGVAFAFTHFQPFDPSKAFHRWGASFANRAINTVFFDGIRNGRVGFPLGFAAHIPGLKESLDYVGLNYYTSNYMKGLTPVANKPGDQVTDMGWIIYPEGLYEILHYLAATVKVPIIVTENGMATENESLRINYMNEHLIQVYKAIEEGIPIRGYMCWSLTDNFEWNRGFDMRFGLVHVDYESQRRRIKEGGRWYSEVIKKNGL